MYHYNIDYFPVFVSSVKETNLNSTCNQECPCSPERYDPVCGADNIVYFSACYAGCKDVTSNDEKVKSI